METRPREGVVKEEKLPNTRKPSHGWEFWDLRGQRNWEENKNKKSTDYAPNSNSQRRSFQTPGNPLTRGSVGSFGISEGNTSGRKNK